MAMHSVCSPRSREATRASGKPSMMAYMLASRCGMGSYFSLSFRMRSFSRDSDTIVGVAPGYSGPGCTSSSVFRSARSVACSRSSSTSMGSTPALYTAFWRPAVRELTHQHEYCNARLLNFPSSKACLMTLTLISKRSGVIPDFCNCCSDGAGKLGSSGSVVAPEALRSALESFRRMRVRSVQFGSRDACHRSGSSNVALPPTIAASAGISPLSSLPSTPPPPSRRRLATRQKRSTSSVTDASGTAGTSSTCVPSRTGPQVP
mmetsp:Transcript_20287/g.61618  ORF Transcript_20287/g.61618 Transcript_20287/m.61618 type:complete len:262 (+) Transcript_20287:1036-1821(+)